MQVKSGKMLEDAHVYDSGQFFKPAVNSISDGIGLNIKRVHILRFQIIMSI
jgi:hypothetical protein